MDTQEARPGWAEMRCGLEVSARAQRPCKSPRPAQVARPLASMASLSSLSRTIGREGRRSCLGGMQSGAKRELQLAGSLDKCFFVLQARPFAKAERSAAGQGGKEKEGQGAGPRGLATPRQLLLARLGAFVEPSASFCLASLWHLASHLARSLAESAKLLPGRSLSKPSERGICFLLTSPLLCSQPRAKNARLGWHRMWLSGRGAAVLRLGAPCIEALVNGPAPRPPRGRGGPVALSVPAAAETRSATLPLGR